MNRRGGTQSSQAVDEEKSKENGVFLDELGRSVCNLGERQKGGRRVQTSAHAAQEPTETPSRKVGSFNTLKDKKKERGVWTTRSEKRGGKRKEN